MSTRRSTPHRAAGPRGVTARAPSRAAHPGLPTGFALPAALVALILIALFVAGSTFFSLQEMQAARGAVTELGAFEAAEYGAAAVLRDWTPAWNTTLIPGTTLGPWSSAHSGGARSTVRMTRLTPTTFWVVAEGRSGGASPRSDAWRRLGATLRLDVADPPIGAALTVRDSADVVGSGEVAGTDTGIGAARAVPPACAAPAADVAGVAAPDTTRVCDGGCGAAGVRITGVPARLAEATAADPWRYGTTGAGAWAALAQRADVVLPPGATLTPAPVASGGACLTSAPGNWGDPGGGACGEYLPVILARGDLTVNGGVGQGILLVEGDLRLADGASFAGVVVVHDDIVTVSGGGVVSGAAFAGDARTGSGDHTVVGDGGAVRWSSCAVARALFGAARPHRVRGRWWAEMP